MIQVNNIRMWQVDIRGTWLGRLDDRAMPVIVGATDAKTAIDIAVDWWNPKYGQLEGVKLIGRVCLLQELEGGGGKTDDD